jgi:hypothetical protein
VAQGSQAQGHADGGGPVERWVTAKRVEPLELYTLNSLAVESNGGHLCWMRVQMD